MASKLSRRRLVSLPKLDVVLGRAGFKPATVNRGTQLLRQAYALAVTRRHLHSMPSIRYLDERNNVRQGYFEELDLPYRLFAVIRA
jgi:hypothetical protein